MEQNVGAKSIRVFAVWAPKENLHHRAAAALVLGRLEEAVGLYLSNEMLAEEGFSIFIWEWGMRQVHGWIENQE